ncbi:MAG TPA: enoyl-CoA hydratase-related protein [Spirochaetota bacterium]|nr:enoyl-CoA hydratase-related protein [Spirochaetota bacterium]
MFDLEEFKFLKFSLTGKTGILTISRPTALNSLNRQLLVELLRAIGLISGEKNIHALIITGEGKSFVAGADIVEMMSLGSEEGRAWGELGSAVFSKIEQLEIPTIAAVNGFALGGGCELAMCCDIRIAAENSKFGQPEVSLGITPGFSGCIRLPRIVGISKAKEMIFTGDVIPASEAEKIGLVNIVVPEDLLMTTALGFAEKLVSRAQLAVRYSKKAINRGMETDIETAIVYENLVFGLCFATSDQKEGMKAFNEKRKPEFRCV